jgi:hypothetical protein
MNSFKFVSVLALIFPMLAHAETVTTTDGRIITLNSDGTYVIESGPTSEVDAYLTLREPFFERHVSQYQQESIRFIPMLTNLSDRAIVGVRFTSSFRDAFGDEIFSFSGDINERVAPGENSTANIFYVFQNNQFINGEPYDKLLPMVTGNTGSVVTTVTGLALDGGEVISFR